MEEKDIHLYIKKEMQMAPYEPVEGVYLGAYVEDIEAFEELLAAKQSFRLFQYTTKGSISQQDLLKCIAKNHIPYIKVLLDEDYDLTRVYTMIGDLNNRYKTPLFIELFPVTQKIEDPTSYKEQYDRAYKLIKKYLDQAVIVWAIDLEKSYEMPLYYPGNHMVDWVGVNCYWPKYQGEALYEVDPLESIDFLYKNFQEEKPMLLSGVAVSHFSTLDHTYTVADAKNKLNVFYEKVIQRYPRIKGIFYIDIDMKAITPTGTDDYRVTTQKMLREYLKEKFEQPIFLQNVYPEEYKVARQYYLYDMSIKAWEGQQYILAKEIDALLRGTSLKELTLFEEDKNQYYNLKDLMEKISCYYTE
jgi:hypothetical protein